MLSVQEVQKSFDHFLAVNKANLEVEKGQVVAVIGPNGAGKEHFIQIDYRSFEA